MSRKQKKLTAQFFLIVLLSSIPFFVTSTILNLNAVVTANRQLHEQVETTTKMIHQNIESLLRSNISIYLKAKVETGRDIINGILEDDTAGYIDLQEKEAAAAKELMVLKVGKTGYIYAVNSEGIVVLHPDKELIGSDQHTQIPVTKQISMKTGYLEYEWQNSYEEEPKNKALQMIYIPEFDWILTATSYRDEFTEIVNIDSIKETINNLRLGESGYSYIIDREANLIVHPLFNKEQDIELLIDNDFRSIVKQLFEVENGYFTYNWKDYEQRREREKIVYAEYLKDFDWVVGTAIFKRDIRGTQVRIFFINTTITAVVVFVLFVFIRKLSKTIEVPLSSIHSTFERAIQGDLSVRADVSGPQEIFELSNNLNTFIETLELRNESLVKTINEKENLIHEIQHRINNNLQIINSIINLYRDYTSDSETSMKLLELQQKITVIGMVYNNMLLSDADFAKDNLLASTFFQDYLSYFKTSFKVSEADFRIQTEFDDIYIQRNSVISCGLIMNELVSKSFKRSLSEKRKVVFDIKLKLNMQNEIFLSFSDDNGSFDESNWRQSMDDVSFLFLDVLIAQLKANVSFFRNGDFSKFLIKFSQDPPEGLSYSVHD